MVSDHYYLPEEFKFSIYRMAGFPCVVVWVRDHFELQALDPSPGNVLSPSPEAWKRFWAKIDRLDVWNWEQEFVDNTILDRTAWELTIKYKGREIHSEGSNGYPGEPVEVGEYSPTFKRFLKAISTLTGIPKSQF